MAVRKVRFDNASGRGPTSPQIRLGTTKQMMINACVTMTVGALQTKSRPLPMITKESPA